MKIVSFHRLLIYLLLYSSCFNNDLFAQELPEITPPTPVAYELGKYGQIPVGMFTGTPNIDIPIYNYSAGGLSVPISLGYSSNGIKVDQLSSNVGLGWNLNVGGVISRIVKDKSDEDRDLFYPESEIHQFGGLSTPMVLDFFYLAGQPDVDTETDVFMFNFLGYSGSFIFNTDGKVVMIPNKDVLIETYTENNLLGFKATTSNGVEYFFLDAETTRNQSTGSGSHPTPEFHTTSWYLSRIVNTNGDQINFIYEDQGYTYNLSKSQSISVPTPLYQNGCEGQSGTGAGYTISPETTSIMTASGKRLIEINSNNLLNGKIVINSSISHPEISSYKLVSSIDVKDNNNTEIETFDFSYLLTNNDRAFLESITFKDPKKEYLFEYNDPQGLVSRLSKAQDYWGYYNGKTSNTYCFPNPQSLPYMPNELSSLNIGADQSINSVYAEKGLLKKLIYPTKGFTEFSYESNSYWGTNTTYPNEQNLILNVSTDDTETGTAYQIIGNLPTVPFNQRASFSIYVSFNSQECNEDTLKSKVEVLIIDDQSGSALDILELQQSGYYITDGLFEYNDSVHTFYVDLVAGHTYTVKLIPKYFCTNGLLNLEYYDQAPTTNFDNIESGGLRVKEVKSYASSTSTPNVMRYYYGKKETPTESSGEKGQTAYYLSKQTNRIPCGPPCGYIEQYFTSLNSSPLRPLFNSSSNGTTYYKYVTVSHGGSNFENGGEENEFIIHNDYPGNPIKGDPIESSTWVNAGWSNGLLKSNTIFKYNPLNNSFTKLKQSINNYIADNRYFENVYGYTVNKKFEFVCTTPVTYSCTSSDLTKQFSFRHCITNHKHWYSSISGNNNQEYECIANGHNNQTTIISHPCYGKSVGYIVTNPQGLDNLDIMEYTTNSYWHYLNQTIEKQYDMNGQNPIEKVTNYFYDNPEHLQLTRVESITSEGKKMATKNTYPDDVNNTTSLGYDDLTTSELNAIKKLQKPSASNLTGQYNIGAPIQVETTIKDENNNLLSKTVQRTNYFEPYTDLILKKEIQTLKGDYNSLINNLEDRIQFISYYSNGNVKEVSKTNGTTIVYIWGYNNQYPIAKIENSTYSIASSFVNNLESLSNSDNDRTLGYSGNEGLLRQALNNMRTDPAFAHALVTTYTYDPLIGVTSMTDAKGYTMYYEYDSFGRFKHVKDKDGHILSENQYNYKQ